MAGIPSNLEALASWVWRASWQATVLIGLVLVAQWLFRRHLPARWRYALWMLVMLRLMLPFMPESFLSIFNYTSSPTFQTVTANKREASAEPTVFSTEPVGIEIADSGTETILDTATTVAAIPENPGPADPPSAAPYSDTFGSLNWKQVRAVLPYIWMAGMFLLLIKLFIQYVRTSLQLAASRRLTTGTLIDLLNEMQKQLGVAGRIEVIETKAVSSPALFGLFRPRLLLPDGMAGSFSEKELRHVLLHELSHLKRRDLASNWIMNILQAVHWFNPLVWYAFYRMRLDRELACDALALAHARPDENIEYGNTIIKILESFASASRRPGLVGILEDKNEIAERMRNIAEYKRSPRWPMLAIALAVGLGAVGLTEAQSERPGRVEDEPSESILTSGSTRASLSTERENPAAIVTQDAMPSEPSAGQSINQSNEPNQQPSSEAATPDRETIPESPKENQEENPSTAITDADEPGTERGESNAPGQFRTGWEQRLDSVVLPEVKYENVPLDQVRYDLEKRCKELGHDIRFGIALPETTWDPVTGQPHLNHPELSGARIRLSLKDARLSEVIKAIIKSSDIPLTYASEGGKVIFKHDGSDSQKLFTRTYRLDPVSFGETLQKYHALGSVLGRTNLASTPREIHISGLQEFLRTTVGIDWTKDPSSSGDALDSLPPGKAAPDTDRGQYPARKAAFYNESTGNLFVRATKQELALIERALSIFAATAPLPIRIDARLVLIADAPASTTRGFDWYLGGVHPTPTPQQGRAPDIGQQPPTNTFPSNSNINTNLPAIATVTGILTDPQFRTVVRALEQSTGVETALAPTVTATSGSEARIEAPEQGFSLKLIPRVAGDNRTVNMEIDFSYQHPNPNEGKRKSSAPKPEPIRISTQAAVASGETITLGGIPVEVAPTNGKKERKKAVLLITATIIDNNQTNITSGIRPRK